MTTEAQMVASALMDSKFLQKAVSLVTGLPLLDVRRALEELLS